MVFVSLPFSLTSFDYILICLGKKIIFLISIFSRFFTKSQGFLEKKLENVQALHEPNLSGLYQESISTL